MGGGHSSPLSKSSRNTPPQSGPYVELYEHCKSDHRFPGITSYLQPGKYRTSEMGIPDKSLSSFKIPPGLSIILWEHDNFSGRGQDWKSSVDCLNCCGWNDLTSSIEVVEVNPTKKANAPNPDSECEKKRIEANKANNDKIALDRDVAKCFPEEARQKNLNDAVADMNKYIDSTTKKLNSVVEIYDIAMNEINLLALSPLYIMAKRYTWDLKSREHEEIKKTIKYKEEEAINRRRFLDGYPQEGTPGFAGLKTEDDQVIGLFWLSYTLFCIFALVLFLIYFGDNIGSFQNKISTFIGGLLGSMLIAHIFIRAFA